MSNIFDVDQLQLYFGDDYVINDKIKISQPTIGDIVDFGEAQYFNVIYTITAIPSDMKSQLWDLGIDWMEIEDFDLFVMLAPTLPIEKTKLLFGDLDFTKLKLYKNRENGDILLADLDTGVKIDKMIYLRIVNYLRKVHNITPKIERAANKTTKQILIDEDRMRIQTNKEKPFKSYLLPLISSVKVRMGYTKDYVRNEGFVEFFDDVSRLQIIHNADHLLSGCYAGTIDMKKINKADLNWLREIN
jgi:hypothetical protein|nr:MAG TPA: hypothetical protein [Caudoviricetes sp.]